MQATMLKRSNSDIERRLELTRVEREPKESRINEEPQKERNDSSSTIEDLEMLEETSDTEDVFQ